MSNFDPQAALDAALDQWIEEKKARCAVTCANLRAGGAPEERVLDYEASWHDETLRMAEAARRVLPRLLADNSHLEADELSELAGGLSPGGTHSGGSLVSRLRGLWLFLDPRLIVATLYHNWEGARIGLEFLPDPAKTALNDYQDQVAGLAELIRDATDGDPRRILTGKDREFYDSLPERFTVYRGASGVTPEQSGAGMCWTTRRTGAEWFARRGGSEPHVLISAPISKQDVLLCMADESEIVATPHRFRALKCRLQEDRPNMRWSPPPACL